METRSFSKVIPQTYDIVPPDWVPLCIVAEQTSYQVEAKVVRHAHSVGWIILRLISTGIYTRHTALAGFWSFLHVWLC